MFDEVGGMEVIDKLVDDFYFIMSTDPIAKDCFKTHEGRDISESANKLKFFLSGWLGGPQLYQEKYGHPRLRMRHINFKIRVSEAEQWMYCIKLAMKKSSITPEMQEELYKSFLNVAGMLVNEGV